MCPNKAILLFKLGAKCPNSDTEAVEVYANIGTAVRLDCGDIGSDTTIIWRYALTTSMIGHNIGSDPVYLDEEIFPGTKYVYNREDHSLTVTDVSLQDEVCYRCILTPSNTEKTSLIVVLGEL